MADQFRCGPQWETAGHLLEDCESGRGRVVLVVGPGGTGKTELLDRFGRHAESRGAAVLRAYAAERERLLPLGVVEQLIGSGGLSPERVRDAELLLTRRHHAGELEAMTLVRELAAALLDAGTTAPLVLIVDDAHHADDESLELLLYLQRRIVSRPVLVVLSEPQLRFQQRISELTKKEG